MKKFLVITGCILIGCASEALGQGYAWTAPAASDVTTNYGAGTPIVLGDAFVDTFNTPGPVTYLGIYAGNTVAAGGEKVSLFDSNGNLLTSIVVFNNDPVVNGYYWAQVVTLAGANPVTLTKGAKYTVAVQVGNNGWGYGPIPNTLNSWATFSISDYNYTNAFPTPATSNGLTITAPAFYGANVWLGPMTVPTVAEGGTLWLYLLLAGIACLGAVWFSSRTRGISLP